MTPEQVTAAAWRELLAGAQSALDDWIDEEGEYGEDAETVYEEQKRLLAALKTTEGLP